MEYERIHHNVQVPGALSPTKLRMKLLGAAHGRFRKDAAARDASRTSPIKTNKEKELSKNRLLISDPDTEESSNDAAVPGSSAAHNVHLKCKAMEAHYAARGGGTAAANSLSMIHPMRAQDEDAGNGSDSGHDNASTCSFEFHRQRSSKWNDAEKWIMNRQGMNVMMHQNAAAKKMVTKRVDSNAMVTAPPGATAVPVEEEPVSMKDVGTEMTPIPSYDPSRTGTPLGSTTPRRSPNTSVPSTPVGDGPEALNCPGSELSDKEMRLRTRQEIAALGMQLGKMSIATWASKEDLDLAASSGLKSAELRSQKEYEARAKAWSEAENSKHTARFKREELKIQEWECKQRAKCEAEMAAAEARAEKMKAEAGKKVAQKLAVTRRTADERRADAESKMKQRAARAVMKAEQIRASGRVPPPSALLCCSLFSDFY